MFDYAYERIIFDNNEAHGVTTLTSYSITRLYNKLVKEYTPAVCCITYPRSYTRTYIRIHVIIHVST